MTKFCGLCGHIMSPEVCGSAGIWWNEDFINLCHADTTDHDCYRDWTIYGERP
jgi:hypothetical protein